jgi:hypothetical protein
LEKRDAETQDLDFEKGELQRQNRVINEMSLE